MESDKQPIIDKNANEDIEEHRISSFNHAVSMDGGRISVPVQSSMESTDLPEIKVYKRRWYILGLFGLLACHQCIVWNTFGPIESAVQYAYHWTDFEAPMLANWGCITFVIFVVPLSKLAEKNLRLTVLIVSGLVAMGTVVRCCHYLITDPTIFLVSSHICAILNGISGVTIMAAPPLISSQWFPPNERTTATSINQAANMLGNGLSMLLGPAMVNIPSNCSTNLRGVNECPDREDIKVDIDNYMVIQAGIAVALFMLFCLYFPSQPPLPPAPSSAIQRMEFWAGTREILRNKTALMLCFAYSMGGILGSWLGVMVNNFRPLGIDDRHIGFIGLFAVLGQVALTTIVGFLMDRLQHKMKITLIFLISIATAGFTWLMLLCLEIITPSLAQIYASVIISASISFACYPIYFEMTVEVTYPVHESIVGGFLTGFYNLAAIIFLLLFFIPNIGYKWIDYALVGSTIIALPAVLLAKETYNRSNVDEAVTNANY